LQAEASFLDKSVNPSTYAVLARVSPGYPPLPGRLPTCYSPVRRSPAAEAAFAHDLHVLSTPPAFILSQDQTLQFRPLSHLVRLTDSAGSCIRNPSRSASPSNRSRTTRRDSEVKPLTLLPLSSFQRTDAPFSEANSESTFTPRGLSSLRDAFGTTDGRCRLFRGAPSRLLSVKEPARRPPDSYRLRIGALADGGSY
jgi:hypothetical protein